MGGAGADRLGRDGAPWPAIAVTASELARTADPLKTRTKSRHVVARAARPSQECSPQRRRKAKSETALLGFQSSAHVWPLRPRAFRGSLCAPCHPRPDHPGWRPGLPGGQSDDLVWFWAGIGGAIGRNRRIKGDRPIRSDNSQAGGRPY
jgi:hypothetical protein